MRFITRSLEKYFILYVFQETPLDPLTSQKIFRMKSYQRSLPIYTDRESSHRQEFPDMSARLYRPDEMKEPAVANLRNRKRI